MSKQHLALLLSCVSVAACDRDGLSYLPVAQGDHPDVFDIGTLGIMSLDQLEEFKATRYAAQSAVIVQQGGDPVPSPIEWCADPENVDAEGNPLCYFGQLSGSTDGVRGGATYTFSVPNAPLSAGGDPIESVCVIVDPEAVFWNQSISPIEREEPYGFPDFPNDDGDLDLFVGMTSYYTGSPGVELGDFKGFYTDSLGRKLEIEYGECIQASGVRRGFNAAHAGRAAAEFCAIEVGSRYGVPFTVVLDTFSVPLDDGALSFGTMLVEGDCRGIVDECTLRGESLEATVSTPVAKDCTPELEEASCSARLQEYCCLHPAMCWDEQAPDDACDTFFAVWDPNNLGIETARENYCSLGISNADGDRLEPSPEICCAAYED